MTTDVLDELETLATVAGGDDGMAVGESGVDPTRDGVTRIPDAEHQDCLDRLTAYREQVREADRRADANTLGRAADVVALYQDMRWVGQLPALQEKRNRGRRVEADSWPRFARWLGAETGLAPSTIYGLRRAHEITANFLCQAEVKPVGERALRPLKPLEKDHPEAIRVIWDDAVEECGGVPDATAVKGAVKRWKDANLPQLSMLERSYRRMARDRRQRIVGDLQALIQSKDPELWATLDDVDRLTRTLERPS